MKKTIELGTATDDGTGDYLRRGGDKINSNFGEVYDELGDGSVLYQAGSWKKWATADGTDLYPDFGESYTIDTTGGSLTVYLPSASSSNYNRSIKLRDVNGTWSTNPVTVVPASGNAISGSPDPTLLDRDLQDVEMVFCSPGSWEYVDNKTVDKITTSDLATVATQEYIATDGQRDFDQIFESNYNISAVEVYRRGNLLYYGDGLTEDSDYGSIPTTENPATEGDLAPLDGVSIRLLEECEEGDTVTVVTYLDGLATYRSSYQRYQITVYDENRTDLETSEGQRWVGNLDEKHVFSLTDFGLLDREDYNPHSVEVLLNGNHLTKAGDADLPAYRCEGADGDDEATCVSNGGTWIPSGADFSTVQDQNDVWNQLVFDRPLEHEDILCVRWYNNDIGTTLDWEGEGGIKEKTDEIYLNSEYTTTISGRIRYTDYDNPGAATSEEDGEVDEDVRWESVEDYFDSIYPIGSIYMNANNPNNPGDYMGIGTWSRFAQGKVLVSWNADDAGDPNFALNENDPDTNGNPRHSAGGTGGLTDITLEQNNIPPLETDEEVLIADDNGDVVIGGCQYDPDEEGPGFDKYREDKAGIQANTQPSSVYNVQPYITVNMWLRIA